MARAPFPINPVYAAIAVAYKNKKLIADEVMPRVPVGKREFKYMKHSLAEGFTIPDTHVGRRSKPNEVEFSSDEETASVEDYGLDSPVPYDDIDNAPEGYDPLANAVESTTDLVLLDREIRVASLIHNSASYAATHRVTQTGTDRVDDPDFDVIGFIQDIIDSMLIAPTDMTLSRKVASKMCRHPDIVKAFHGNSGDRGKAPVSFLAELFELDRINVGEAFVNAAKKGQAPSIQRAWQDRIALHVNDRLANTMNKRITFAMTAQYQDRIAGSTPDKNIGLRGGEMVRAGESVKELITASDLGFLIIDPLTP